MEACERIFSSAVTSIWRDIEPAAFVTEYAMVLPIAATPAIDEVTKNTPPSRFALNVGSAARRRCKLALQFTAQDFGLSQHRHASGGIHCYLIPIFFSHEIKIAKVRSFLPQFRKLCIPLQCIRRSRMEIKLARCAVKNGPAPQCTSDLQRSIRAHPAHSIHLWLL